jgi:hypothetical protein
MGKVEDLRVTVLDRADKNDPTNTLVVVGVRGYVDGKQCGWRGKAEWSLRPGESWSGTLERAIESLLKQMIAKPAQPIEDVLRDG